MISPPTWKWTRRAARKKTKAPGNSAWGSICKCKVPEQRIYQSLQLQGHARLPAVSISSSVRLGSQMSAGDMPNYAAPKFVESFLQTLQQPSKLLLSETSFISYCDMLVFWTQNARAPGDVRVPSGTRPALAVSIVVHHSLLNPA
jgi:hypothetical protein